MRRGGLFEIEVPQAHWVKTFIYQVVNFYLGFGHLTTNFGRSAALDTIFSYVPLKNLTLHLEDVNFSKKLE